MGNGLFPITVMGKVWDLSWVLGKAWDLKLDIRKGMGIQLGGWKSIGNMWCHENRLTEPHPPSPHNNWLYPLQWHNWQSGPDKHIQKNNQHDTIQTYDNRIRRLLTAIAEVNYGCMCIVVNSLGFSWGES